MRSRVTESSTESSSSSVAFAVTFATSSDSSKVPPDARRGSNSVPGGPGAPSGGAARRRGTRAVAFRRFSVFRREGWRGYRQGQAHTSHGRFLYARGSELFARKAKRFGRARRGNARAEFTKKKKQPSATRVTRFAEKRRRRVGTREKSSMSCVRSVTKKVSKGRWWRGHASRVRPGAGAGAGASRDRIGGRAHLACVGRAARRGPARGGAAPDQRRGRRADHARRRRVRRSHHLARAG